MVFDDYDEFDDITDDFDLSINEALNAYFAELKRLNRRPKTIINKKEALKPRVPVWEKMGITKMSEITSKNVKQNLFGYAQTPSIRTGRTPGEIAVRDKYVIFNTWLSWAFLNRQIRRRIKLTVPDADDPVIQLYSDDQVMALLDCTTRYWDVGEHPEVKHFREIDRRKFCLRARAILAMAMSSGLRREEISNLQDSDWDRDRMVFIIRVSKGRMARSAVFQQI